MRQTPDTLRSLIEQKSLLSTRYPCICSISFFRNPYRPTQDKPQKPMRTLILIRFPCYSNSFVNTLEEENLGNQAKRDYDFRAATVKLGFQGTKMVNVLGEGSIYTYIYICEHM